MADSINKSDSSEEKISPTKPSQLEDGVTLAKKVLNELSIVLESEESGTTPVQVRTSISHHNGDEQDSNPSSEDRGARVLKALLQAQKENEEKRRQLQEDYEK